MHTLQSIKEQLDRIRRKVGPKIYLITILLQNTWSFAFAMGYLLFPFDLIPDFLPVVGYLDDVAVIANLLGLIIKGAAD